MKLLFFSFIFGISARGCPDLCNCNENVVQCQFLQLTNQPVNFPANMTVLNLGHNKLEKFSTEGLNTNLLEKLQLRNNSISVFLDRDRKRYPNMEVLDLRYNKY